MNSKRPTMSISFDRDTSYLYHYIIQESSATHIKASGLIRKILMEHYDNKHINRTTNTAKEGNVLMGTFGGGS
jgi:hypothetical protein